MFTRTCISSFGSIIGRLNVEILSSMCVCIVLLELCLCLSFCNFVLFHDFHNFFRQSETYRRNTIIQLANAE